MHYMIVHGVKQNHAGLHGDSKYKSPGFLSTWVDL